MSKKPLLHIDNLRTSFHTADGKIPAVDGVSFDIQQGQSVALVGESGSGKSVTALSILRLLQMPPAKIEADAIFFEDTDIQKLSIREMRKVRGNDISMIFQEPMTSLNPLMTVGHQVEETVILHLGLSKKEARRVAVDMFEKVGIPEAAARAKQYPHQMSGGMRQRIMIAMALSCNPSLLIADEPTTALDVTIQAQILNLISGLQKENKMAMLLITHNLGIVAEVAEMVIVMYAGQIVESSPVESVFTHPLHPYTHGLLKSLPRMDEKVPELHIIKGVVPSPMFFPKGCRFNPRCEYATEKCRREPPPYVEIVPGHKVRCHYPLSDERGKLDG